MSNYQQPQPSFPAAQPPRNLYSAPPPPSQTWGQAPSAPSRPWTPAQQAWNSGQPQAFAPQGPPPPQYAQQPPPPQGQWGPQGGPPGYGGSYPPAAPAWAAPSWAAPMSQKTSVQRHHGPSGPDGTWEPDDLVVEPEAMLNEAQLAVWKKFDNKEIDRDGVKPEFLERVRSGQMDWGKWARDQKKWKNVKRWIIAAISIGIGIAFIVEKDDIVDAIKPFSDDLRNLTYGWLIPAALLFVLSFPPLVGAEIVVILAALTWSIMEAWGVATVGTLAGEVANYWLFRFLLRNAQQKYEAKSVYWAKLSKVSKDGGFFVVLAIRYSLIPTHLSTTLFAACRVNWWIYIIATVLSQPRWLFHVYVGHVYGTTETTTEKYIFLGVSVIFTVITIGAMKWIRKQEVACDAEVKATLRKRRADALNAARGGASSSRSPSPAMLKPAQADLADPNARGGVYRLDVPARGHHANPSTSSFGSNADTVVGSNEGPAGLK